MVAIGYHDDTIILKFTVSLKDEPVPAFSHT